MKIRITLAALVMLAVALTGCMGDSVAPIDNPPAAPQGLTLALNAEGSSVLQWRPNTESDLAGYDIYRVNIRVGETNQIEAVTETSIPDALYPVPNVPGHWQYHVRAIDRAGQRSAASAPVTVILAHGGREAPPDEGSLIRVR